MPISNVVLSLLYVRCGVVLTQAWSLDGGLPSKLREVLALHDCRRTENKRTTQSAYASLSPGDIRLKHWAVLV